LKVDTGKCFIVITSLLPIISEIYRSHILVENHTCPTNHEHDHTIISLECTRKVTTELLGMFSRFHTRHKWDAQIDLM